MLLFVNTCTKKCRISGIAMMLAAIILLLTANPTQAQKKARLYAAVLQTNNFVVGRSTFPSGLFSFDQDTTWTHYGWSKNRLNGISYDPANTDYMFMACGNGAFRTTDGGKTWRRTTGWSITEVEDVSVDPVRPNDVYIATAYGIWKTTDRGATWDSASVGLDSTFVQTIQVDQKDGSYILTGGEGGIYRSTNGAKSWEHVGPVGVPIRDIQQNTDHPDLWIAGTKGHGVLISNDGGRNWHFARGGVKSKTIYAVATDPNNPDHMAAAGYETGVYISRNAGKSWSRYTKGLPTRNFHALIFDPEVKGKLWAGTYNYGVYATANEGKSWTYKGLAMSQVWDLVFVSEFR